MGNKIARTTQASASEYYLSDLPSSYNLVLKEVLGRGRFLKSILCKHDEGLVLVKVYFKRGGYVDLKEYEKRLYEVREVLQNVQHPHVWPFQFWLETDKAAYLLRQYFFSNLLDRLNTRPFLSLVEKKWIAFQLLNAVKQCHENGISHGDIKCENILVTSWNWLYLADFASFKPTFIPDDDPSDFSFFFDTGGRRRCYLAPERFYEHGGETQVGPDALLKPSMDIFSLGCVLAELFLEGQPLFELCQLLAYRRGQYDPCQSLEKVPDSGLRKMIVHMIQLDSESRLSAQSYLQDYAPYVFPSYFSPFLHNFFSCLTPLDSDTRVAVTRGAFSEICKQVTSKSRKAVGPVISASSVSLNEECFQLMSTGEQRWCVPNDTLRNDLKQMNESLVGEIHSLLDVLQGHSLVSKEGISSMPESCAGMEFAQKGVSDSQKNDLDLKSINLPSFRMVKKSDYNLLMSDYNSESDTFGMSFFRGSQIDVHCEGMILIASVLCSCLRSVRLPQLRRGAILLLKCVSLYIDDDERLQRVIPYVVSMLSDAAAVVRCAALETICDVLSLVYDFPPSDAKVFPEYILPMLSALPEDPEESVRICYATNLYKIASAAYRFLVFSKNHGKVGISDGSTFSTSTSALLELTQLRTSIATVVHDLAMGPKQTLNVRLALLQNIGNLCCFFGQKKCNDFLLPILPAFLNDRDDQVRAIFYRQIVLVCFFVGKRSVEEYLLPYIKQALSDAMEAVVVSGAECLNMLCKYGLLQKRILLEVIGKAFPLLSHPCEWVRRSIISFVVASSDVLGPVDSFVYLLPVLRPFLKREPASLSSANDITYCLKPPVSRQAFFQAMEAVQCSDMLERQRKIWYNSSAVPKQQNMLHLKGHHENVTSLPYTGDNSRSRGQQDVAPSSTCSVDARYHLQSEKLQFSELISPQNASSSFISDAQSGGIPLYSFHMDRGTAVLGTSCSESSLPWNSVGVGTSSMPRPHSSSNSFILAGSVSPKLICGSFVDIYNYPKQTRKGDQDTYKKGNDQSVLVTSKFQDMDLSMMMKENSPFIEGLTEAVDFPYFSSGAIISDNEWKPRGVLLAHLQEHRAAVNDIAVSSDSTFFISASSDSTVKVWDTRKLEKDISFRSRLTYGLDGTRALCAAVLHGSPGVAVGTDNGSIHLFSLDCVPRGLSGKVEKYTGFSDVKKRVVGEGAILRLTQYCTDGASNHSILYSTQGCAIHLWDTRIGSSAWNLKAAPDEGYISSFVVGPCGNWLVSGSSRGVLTLWDLRFLLPVNSWQYGRTCPVEKMCLFVPPLSGTSSIVRPLVYIAAGFNEVSLWNAENGSCHKVLRVSNYGHDLEMPEIPWALARPSRKSSLSDSKYNANSKYRIDELTEPSPHLPGIRSLLPLPGGDLLTGGSDMKIRRWDHFSPHNTYCICGPSMKGIMMNDELYETRSCFSVQVVQEKCKNFQGRKLTSKEILEIATADAAGCHRDSILALASAKLNQRLLISSSRDGAIKVWK